MLIFWLNVLGCFYPFKPMDLPSRISRTSPFLISGMLAGTFNFFPNFNQVFFKQTMETNQTPHSVASNLGLRYLPVSRKKTLGLYGSMFPHYQSNELVYAEYDHPYGSFYCIILVELDPFFVVRGFRLNLQILMHLLLLHDG